MKFKKLTESFTDGYKAGDRVELSNGQTAVVARDYVLTDEYLVVDIEGTDERKYPLVDTVRPIYEPKEDSLTEAAFDDDYIWPIGSNTLTASGAKRRLSELRNDLKIMLNCDTLADVQAHKDEFVMYNCANIVERYVEKGMSEEDAIEKMQTQIMRTWNKWKEDVVKFRADADNAYATFNKVKDALTQYELIEANEDACILKYRPIDGATHKDCVEFVDAVVAAVKGRYNFTGRGGSWTRWDILTSEGVALKAGWDSDGDIWSVSFPRLKFESKLTETYWIDSKDVMTDVDRLGKELEADGFKYYGDRYSGSTYYNFFTKRGDNGAICKAVQYNYDGAQIIDIDVDQLMGYKPIDSFEKMRRDLGKMLLPQNEAVQNQKEDPEDDFDLYMKASDFNCKLSRYDVEEAVNPADLTDCPECGGPVFDSRRGVCTKCSYRESLTESATVKHLYYAPDPNGLKRGQWLDVKEENGRTHAKWSFSDEWSDITDRIEERPHHHLVGNTLSKTFTFGGWRFWMDDEVEKFWEREGHRIRGNFEIPGMPNVRRDNESKSIKEDSSCLTRYVICGVTNEGTRMLYDAVNDNFTTDYDSATKYDDMDAARDDWFKIPRFGFRRIFIPIYDPAVFESLNEGSGADTAHVASDALKIAAQGDKHQWAKTAADIIDVIPDDFADQMFDAVKAKASDIKLSAENKKKLVDASNGELTPEDIEDCDTLGKILALVDGFEWAEKNPGLLKGFVMVVLSIIAIIEPTPVLEIIILLLDSLPTEWVAKILAILNLTTPTGMIGTAANKIYKHVKKTDEAFDEEPVFFDPDDEFEVDFRYYVYANEDSIVSDPFEFEEDAIDFAKENNYPIVKVHNYYRDTDGQLNPDGDPEVVWKA